MMPKYGNRADREQKDYTACRKHLVTQSLLGIQQSRSSVSRPVGGSGRGARVQEGGYKVVNRPGGGSHTVGMGGKS